MTRLYAVVYSLGDPAGRGAAERLASMLGGGRPCRLPRPGSVCSVYDEPEVVLAGFREDVVELDFLDEVLGAFRPRAYIVLSRHSSASGEPTLSVHHPGNPGPEARHGGRPRELAIAFPRLAKLLAQLYHRRAESEGLLSEYRFTLEATHHGPTGLSRPVVFVEIGSTEDRWRDPRAQEALAHAVLEALAAPGLPDCRAAVGIGDTHYPRSHTRLMLGSDVCYGHILAKHVLPDVDEAVLLQAVERSADPVRLLVLQKPPSRVRRMAEALASRLGLDVVRA